MSRSWRRLSKDYADPAINVVRLIVAADRQCGMKTSASLEVRAPELQIQPRRLRRLFENDRDPVVGVDEYGRLLLFGARVLRRIADRMRERVEQWEAEADLLEVKHKQLTLDGDGEWDASHGGKRPLRRAA